MPEAPLAPRLHLLLPDCTSPAPPPTFEKMSKANWSPEMTTVFCNLAAKEKEKGNRPAKFFNPAGYKNVEVGFFQQTGKLYSRLQFKNKWGSLRTLYRDWLILKNTSTGLGWNDETNTMIADDEWWKKADEVQDSPLFQATLDYT
ncbi:L10-interacting MYB domain-containing protein-like isoform X2 [Triticum dicoccoides]|uniref:L10-interacting MYB domain-containing protein-like isoform X2 n=1 Tax=Triticum dicoccoides TaxID=85692 RepID=UPI0018905303|nr:L10-interacting MYB domain-containing protein-like isoform X2 [Triticum dicoccoides]